jgi:C-terminal processing protease CtpA/Prc
MKENKQLRGKLKRIVGIRDSPHVAQGRSSFKTITAFMVIAHAPAADAGIQPGDIIFDINGKPASNFTLEEARRYFEHAIGKQKLRIVRHDTNLDVTIDCKPLV